MSVNLEDVRAIERLKHEYCYTIDSGDYDAWVGLFTEDGRFVRTGKSVHEGQEELTEFATEGFDAAFEQSAHVVTNPVIDVDEGGAEATGTWYLLLLYEDSAGEAGWTQARYDDEYRKVDGEWRIADATITYGVTHDA